MRGHPIAAYFTLVFAITWALHAPMVLGKQGLGIFPYEVPMALVVILFILGAITGPTLSAFLVTNTLDGKEGMRKLFRRYGQWRVGLPWYVLAIFVMPTIYIMAGSIVLGRVPLADIAANWTTFFSPFLVAILIFPALITLGEEPGWRGFALTRMQEHYHPVLSGAFVGFMHSLWHLPVFFLISGPVAFGPFDLAEFANNIAVSVAVAILWTWVFNHAKGSILIAVLLHASLNASEGWVSVLIPNFPMDAAGKIIEGFFFVAAVALIFMTNGRLGYPADPAERN
jgi:membrane protease YdiL (CAAX protease family)